MGSGAKTRERGRELLEPEARTVGEGQLHNKKLEQEVSGLCFTPMSTVCLDLWLDA
jgi:hypothetical protein